MERLRFDNKGFGGHHQCHEWIDGKAQECKQSFAVREAADPPDSAQPIGFRHGRDGGLAVRTLGPRTCGPSQGTKRDGRVGVYPATGGSLADRKDLAGESQA